jgi:hypothetical protein
MNLILILVVAVMAGPRPKIRQLLPPRHKRKPLLPAHQPVAVPVQEAHELVDRARLVHVVDGGAGLVLVAVRRVQLVEVPVPAVVEVVQLEEGPRVEVGDVMLFCGTVSRL